MELIFSGAIVIEEEKHLVLLNRSADRGAEVVPLQTRSGLAIKIIEPIVGIKDLVAEEVVDAAVKTVRARTCDDIDQGCAGKTIFRAKIALLYFELLYCIHRWYVSRRENPAVLFEIGCAYTVQQDIGCGIPAAVRDEVVHHTSLATRIHFSHTRSQRGEISKVTINQWQIVNQPPVYYLAPNWAPIGELHAALVHFHDLFRHADFHGKIDRDVLIDLDDDAFLPLALETRSFDGDRVPSGGKLTDYISARRVSRCREREAFVLIDRLHMRT